MTDPLLSGPEIAVAATQILLFVALAIFVPLRLARILPWHLNQMPRNFAISVLILILASTLLRALPYIAERPRILRMFWTAPGQGLAWLLELALLPAMIWGPVLLAMTALISWKIARTVKKGSPA